MNIRKPAFANSFYPADKYKLQKQIQFYLDQNKKLNSLQSTIIKLLIVPHAGYDYSGLVAAAGFKQLENQNFQRIILIGSSHQFWFEGATIDENDFWETPLGRVEVDKNLVKRLVNKKAKITLNSRPHYKEHSLEVQLPFLQTALSDFKVVPILLGQTDNLIIEQFGNLLAKNLDHQTLVVISSDLSHYPKYEDAQKIDNETINSILSGDINNFEQTIFKNMVAGYKNLQTCACGAEAIKLAIKIAQNLKQGNWRLVKYANSGDSLTKIKDQVVGYAAIVWSQNRNQTIKQSENNNTLKLNAFQKKLLLKIARETLEAKLQNKPLPHYNIADSKLNQNFGVFVTLTKKGDLRGCIGNFEPKTPLWLTVQKQVLESALNDPRFPPVTYGELKEIAIEISVLSKPEKIDDWRKIKLGKHGVILRNGGRGGTFLPQVATETGWDLETFLSQLCFQKCGLPSNCYQDPNTEIFVYAAEVFSEK